MNKEARIYIAGHRGLVGSAIHRKLISLGYQNLILRPSKECDLRDQAQVRELFEQEKPEYVFLAAAKVGGILANNQYPVEFLEENLLIQLNVIRQAYQSDVERLLFLGSSCIYPKDCPQPIKEEYLLTGPLELTNRAYALAKIAGIEQCWAYNREYGTKYLAAMPTNLYGPNDNYDLNTSHVLPALIRKIHEAKNLHQKNMTAWGSGKPRREFLFSDDLADACVFLLNLSDQDYLPLVRSQEGQAPLINVGFGSDVSIEELIETIKQVIGFEGETLWDKSKPDGTMKKLMDSSRIKNLGWSPKVSLKEGIGLAYQDYLRRYVQKN